MRRVSGLSWVLLGVLWVGCPREIKENERTPPGPGPTGEPTVGTPEPTAEGPAEPAPGMLTLAPAGQEMQPTPPPASRAQEVLQQAHTHMKQGNAQQALATLDQAIALQPDFFEALNDKAWILATHPDPKVRNPDQALELAKRALDSMASAGMLRKNRDAFADQHSTGRMIIVMSTVAAALAAQGHFSTAQTNPGEPTSRASTQLRSSGGCGAGGDAMAVQTYVVQAARELHTRFNTPSTGQALQQSQRLLELYRAGKPPVGENQVASSTSPLTKLR